MYKTADIPIEELNGVGKKRADIYHKLGVLSVYALLRYFPRSYIDFSNPVRVADLQLGEVCAIFVTIEKKLSPFRTKTGTRIFHAYAGDSTGRLKISIFNNHYAFDSLKEGEPYYLYGKIGGNFTQKEINSPIIIPASDHLSMRPVYPLTGGITTNMIMTNVKQALEIFTKEEIDLLPNYLLEENNLLDAKSAYRSIHFPDNFTALQKARERLVFEELLSWQLGLSILRKRKAEKTTVKLLDDNLEPFLEKLPFSLTKAQERVLSECVADCKSDRPMSRLIQGDVGSGKTIIATALCYLMAKNNYQSTMMAPTEILALQHYKTLKEYLEPMGVTVTYLVGSLKKSEKESRKKEIAEGKWQVVVGTHALFQESTIFNSLGLVITDEQHRFGVQQRQRLIEKGNHPHTMVMSATPIPRTLALIMYGDLNISAVDELPKGRKKIQTLLVSSSKRRHALGFVKNQLLQGRQAYIVCPAIEPDERKVANIEQYIGKLKEWFPEFEVGYIHSKLPSQEKEDTMKKFQEGEIQLLLGTTVVEVGVDVSNATVMMIENADLFGLSQLHQLRGRVGRSDMQSYCILISDGAQSKERLQILCDTSDGFLISEKDLQLRGPGDFFGSRQHGLPDFKIANMFQDMAALERTRRIADEIIEGDPLLSKDEHKGLRFLMEDLFGEIQVVL